MRCTAATQGSSAALDFTSRPGKSRGVAKESRDQQFFFGACRRGQFPNTFPTARAVGYLLPLFRSCFQVFRRCSKIELRPFDNLFT